MRDQDPVQTPSDTGRGFDVQAPLVARATPSPAPADRRSALRVLAWTAGAGLLVSGLIEYQGWQIIFRTLPSLAPTIPLGNFVPSTLKTLAGALGLGAACGAVGLLLPALRRRPWRTFAAGVAIGTASFLGFLAWLTSLAP